jgi:hypothetical protein
MNTDGAIISSGLVDLARFVTARDHFGDPSKRDYAGFLAISQVGFPLHL